MKASIKQKTAWEGGLFCGSSKRRERLGLGALVAPVRRLWTYYRRTNVLMGVFSRGTDRTGPSLCNADTPRFVGQPIRTR